LIYILFKKQQIGCSLRFSAQLHLSSEKLDNPLIGERFRDHLLAILSKV